MELTLIKAGGFIGKVRTASIDIANPSQQLKKEIDLLESNAPPKNRMLRDREHYTLEVDGVTKGDIDPNTLSGELKTIVNRLMAKLPY
jgi:hypothetical protein